MSDVFTKRTLLEEELTEQIIGAALEVHRELGPGLLESAYQQCLQHELGLRGLSFRPQVDLPLSYKGIVVECSYVLDLLVEDRVVVEIKAVDRLSGIHEAQL